MTVATQGLVNPVGGELVTLTQASPGVGVARTAEVVAPGGGAGSKTVYAIQVDNTLNPATTYLKCWTSSPAVGGDAPTVILKASASTKVQYSFDVGFTMSAIYAATLTTNGTVGTTAPDATVTVKFLLS